MKRKKSSKEEPSESESVKGAFPVVAMGASAGGLEALQEFFDKVPKDAGMAFVVIQHVSAQGKSMLGSLLEKHTQMEVVGAQDRMQIKPNRVYLNPPGSDVSLFNGEFLLSEQEKGRGARYPIDHFFRSLAMDLGHKSVCVVFSGTGSDGTLGLRAIKEAGGLTIVQDPEQAKFDGMPRSAIETGLVDLVVRVEDMPRELLGYVSQPYFKAAQEGESDEKLFLDHVQKILLLLRSTTGRDFTHYKQNTIRRRIKRRMAIHKVEDIRDYYRYLRENPEEINRLFKELLILVTKFFRDPKAFEELAGKVIPDILHSRKDDEPVRVWVPACATGEEAVSIAILFEEAGEGFNRRMPLQIFATDLDPEAILRARACEYSEAIEADVSIERLKRFFIKNGHIYRLKTEIRDRLVFAVQNLAGDPPFSNLDLISCRNVLIYMDTSLQKKVLSLFHYTLNQNGYLMLGTSETIGESADLFSAVDIKSKLFKAKKVLSDRSIHETAPQDIAPYRPAGRRGVDPRKSAREIVERMVLDEYAPACVLVNERLNVLYFQGLTQRYLLTPKGEPSFNLLKIAPEGLRERLPLAFQKVVRSGESLTLKGIEIKANGNTRLVDVTIRSVENTPGVQTLLLVVFTEKDPSELPKPVRKKGGAAREASPQNAGLEQELESIRANLQATIEELEASNEELKSTNEELQSANEELQSMNEEVETAKEELQSVNEELTTVNSELQAKVDELMAVSNDVDNLLASTEIGTIFLDNDLAIKRFTPSMTRLFSLIPSDVGRSIRDITSKINCENLFSDARAVIETLQAKESEVQTRDGKRFSVRTLPYRTKENLIDGIVITFTDITRMKVAEESMQEAKLYSDAIVETVREPLIALDADLRVVSANRAFQRTFKLSHEEMAGRRIYELGDGQWDIPALRELLERIIAENSSFEEFEIEHNFPLAGLKKMLLNARRIEREEGQQHRILLAIEDITERAEKEAELNRVVEELKGRLEAMEAERAKAL
ncbi:MAG: chemotaxis protein CheB [Syntrophobacteraceae bacterium]